MKPRNRNQQTPHKAFGTQLRFADVIDEVSQLAADPMEASLVIERMFRRREIFFADDFAPEIDSFELLM
jgi:hypothetical protein